MSDQYRVIITPRASRDIARIHSYISADSPGNASRMVERVMDALEPLAQFPHRKTVEIASADLRYPVRSLVVHPYLIYFRVIEAQRTVRVLHVRHGARQSPRKL